MATSSFDKGFTVKDKKTANRVHKQLERKNTVWVVKKDVKAESTKGVDLLKRSL